MVQSSLLWELCISVWVLEFMKAGLVKLSNPINKEGKLLFQWAMLLCILQCLLGGVEAGGVLL